MIMSLYSSPSSSLNFFYFFSFDVCWFCVWCYLLIISAASERWSAEEVFVGEGVSKIGEEGVYGVVRSHRSAEKRELCWNLGPSINLWCYSRQCQGKSPGRLFCSSWLAGSSLSCHLWPPFLQRSGRVRFSFTIL